MSSAIADSFAKSQGSFYKIARVIDHKEHRHTSKYGHLSYLLNIPAKTTIPSNSLTAQAVIDFEIKAMPSYFIRDKYSIWLQIKANNSDGTNTVTPTFVEAFLDKNSSVEWMQNGQVITNPYPLAQLWLEPAIELGDNEYQGIVNLLNHNSSLTYTSVTAIAASGSATYYLKIPAPFLGNQGGFWLGALQNNTLTLRLRTQTGGAVSAGTGTLVCPSDGFQLLLDCITVPADDWKELENEWRRKSWHHQECVIQESPGTITLVASGDSPKLKLDNFSDLEVTYIIAQIHASRSFTGSAYFNNTTLPNTAQAYLQSKDGSQIFTSNLENYGFQRYVRATHHVGDSKLFQSQPLLLFSVSPELQSKIHSGSDDGKFMFTGDENLILRDTGSTASVYIDCYAFVDRYYTIENGLIKKVH